MKFDRGLTTLLHDELHWLDMPERVTYKLASWCTVVFTVWHLGTLLTISLLPLTSLRGFVCIPQTDISSLYLTIDSILTAIGRFQLPVQRSGIHCRASWEIQRAVLTVLNSFSRQSFLVSTNVTSALEVFFKKDMRYINSRFTYLLTSATDTCIKMHLWRLLCIQCHAL